MLLLCCTVYVIWIGFLFIKLEYNEKKKFLTEVRFMILNIRFCERRRTFHGGDLAIKDRDRDHKISKHTKKYITYG